MYSLNQSEVMTVSIYQFYFPYTHGKYLVLSNEAQLECTSSMTEEELLKGLKHQPQDNKKNLHTFAILKN